MKPEPDRVGGGEPGGVMSAKTLKRRVYEDVVEQIEHTILTGGLRAGDRLSSERALIGQFGVSRATIREALRVLQSRGLVEVRHGDPGGPMVRADPGAGVTAVLGTLFRADQLTLANVIQFRMMVEGTAAALAAHAPPETVARIREAFEGMRGTTSWPEQVRADVLFHRRVAETSGNPLFPLVVDALHQFNSIATFQSSRSLEQARRETLEVHGMILEAIETGKAAEAAQRSRYHLRRTYQPIIGEVDDGSGREADFTEPVA